MPMAKSAAGATAQAFQASQSLRHDVRSHLRDLIFNGTLKPGDRIIESRLARELGISQAPVREALRELEQMGLVVSYPNRGSSVRRIEPRDAQEMYSLRAHLETLAVRLAIPRLTDADIAHLEETIEGMVAAAHDADDDRLTTLDAHFHEFILERSGHQLLMRTWKGINPLNWTAITVIRLRNRNLLDLAERHRPILDALRARDAAAAEAVIQDHVLVLGERVVRTLEAEEGSDAGGTAE
jgi:DNA-binding GntR family transcriptional regulator